MYREFHVCSSSIVTLHERLGLCNLDGQGIRSAGGSTDVAPHALWAAEKWQDPLLGQESMYCKQTLPLKRGNDLVAEAGNTRALEGSALTGVRMGRC